jgi:hypothetical protein
LPDVTSQHPGPWPFDILRCALLDDGFHRTRSASSDSKMAQDPLSPLAPAKVRVLVLPLGQIKRARFATFLDRLSAENVVHLRDISVDGRPNRSKTLRNPLQAAEK